MLYNEQRVIVRLTVHNFFTGRISLLGGVQPCCTELFHTFSPDQLNRKCYSIEQEDSLIPLFKAIDCSRSWVRNSVNTFHRVKALTVNNATQTAAHATWKTLSWIRVERETNSYIVGDVKARIGDLNLAIDDTSDDMFVGGSGGDSKSKTIAR